MSHIIDLIKFVFIFYILVFQAYAIVGPPLLKSEYPRQSCIILYYDQSKTEIQSLCSGTLVSQNQVLTAGHCEEDQITSPTRVICDHGSQTSWVKDRDTHLMYKSAGEGNDIAILELSNSLSTPAMKIAKNHLEITQLIRRENNCAIFGFGLDSNLKAGKLNGTKAQFSSVQISTHMVAIGTNRHALQGDSGGGLNCKDDENHWIRVGTISRATPGISVVEYLTPNMEWIAGHLNISNKKIHLPKIFKSLLQKKTITNKNINNCLRNIKKEANLVYQDETKTSEKFQKSILKIKHSITHLTSKFGSLISKEKDSENLRSLIRKMKIQNNKLGKILSACRLKINELKRPRAGQTYKVDIYAWVTLENARVATIGTNETVSITISKIQTDKSGNKIVSGTLIVSKGEEKGTLLGAGRYENVKLSYRKLAKKRTH